MLEVYEVTALLHMCTKYLCLEIPEDMSRIVLRTTNSYGEAIVIDINDVDEAVEVLEEISNIVSMALQYIKEVRYGKGYNPEFHVNV